MNGHAETTAPVAGPLETLVEDQGVPAAPEMSPDARPTPEVIYQPPPELEAPCFIRLTVRSMPETSIQGVLQTIGVWGLRVMPIRWKEGVATKLTFDCFVPWHSLDLCLFGQDPTALFSESSGASVQNTGHYL